MTLAGGELTVVVDTEGFSRPIQVGVGDVVRELRAGDRCAFRLDTDAAVVQSRV